MIEAWTEWEGHVVNGEFQLQKYLGGSKHSAVFLTERRGPDPVQAAIKLVPASEANTRKYFFRWDLAARLSHPHLIRLLQQGHCRLGEEDLLYLVMEYAEENLAEILPQRALTPAEVRGLLEPALDALSYLHGRGFVHGHLKPANVLATKDQLKLACDGLCRPGAAALAAGEPDPYDPPERASGATLPAADVWSLGMTLTEALTQRLPEWSEKETADPVVPETLPRPLLDIVRGCLRRDPERRLTITEIKAYLHPSLSSPQKPAPSPRPRPAVEPQEELSKRSLLVPLIVVLAAIALFSGLGWLRRQPEAPPQNAAAKPEPRQSETSSPAAGQRANSLSASSNAKPSPASRRRDAAQAAVSPAAPNLAAAIQPAAVKNSALNKILPDVPQSAKDTIQGTIRVGVKVHVNSYGNVAGAELDTPGPSRYFARLATEAAQNWKFVPSSQNQERQFVVRFDFTNTETRAWATQLP